MFIIFWIVKSNELPKNKNKIGLIIAIKTQSYNQIKTIKNQLIRKINEELKDNGLLDLIDVYPIFNYKTNSIINTLDRYKSRQINLFQDEISSKELQKTKEYKNWLKLQKKVNGIFWVWGKIYEGNSSQKIILSLDAIVTHGNTDLATTKQLSEDFGSIWHKRIEFNKQLESLNGFEFSGDCIFIAVEFICGMAAFISGDIQTAFLLHKKITQNNFQNLIRLFPENYMSLKNKIILWNEQESALLAKKYLIEKNTIEAFKKIEHIFNIKPNSYLGYLILAIYQRDSNMEISTTIRTIEKAAEINPTDNCWRYSKAFLLLLNDQINDALKEYKKLIHQHKQNNEKNLINDVIINIYTYLRNHPDKYQMYFALGFIQYKRNSNLSDGYCNFQDFIEKANNNTKYKLLTDEANNYMDQINNKISNCVNNL